ncbi:DUF3048 domain-containing protein [Patescibacteria group bacterium]
MKKQQLFTFSVIGISLYLIAAGISFALFSYFGGGLTGLLSSPEGKKDQEHFNIDPDAPKTAECPINGKMYTEVEKDIWETRRPLAVMIENHEESRPQSGLSYADVVYEAVAEGGITRFMGIYYCGIGNPVNFAPVRSSRIYYVNWVLEYDALYSHVGGAGNCGDPNVHEGAKALCKIDEDGVKDLDQMGLNFMVDTNDGDRIKVCYRNENRLDRLVATEHTMVCASDGLYREGELRGWTNEDEKGNSWDEDFEEWKFKDDKNDVTDGATDISYVAWSGYEDLFGVRWEYDSAVNGYKRNMAGESHIDHETQEQIVSNNVVVLFAKETAANDAEKHLLYDNIGEGDSLIFQDGIVIEGTWEKPKDSSRTIFYDSQGDEIEFTRGQVWISMLDIGTDVTY